LHAPLSQETVTNRLLCSLSRNDFELLRPHLERVELPYRHELYRANQSISFVYFFETGVGSLVNTMHNGEASEVGTIGNEGIVGLPILLADRQAPSSVFVQVPGAGLRMAVEPFDRALLQSASLRIAMYRYAHAFFNQVAQTAACNHHHSLDQRCARWLLMTYDRMDSDAFLLTHEFLAMMLGVRRAGVTEAAGVLQRSKLIRYSHGKVNVLDVEGLRKCACECYEVVRRDFDRLLGSPGTQP
jgi:CRP-like cAMP-binding protein